MTAKKNMPSKEPSALEKRVDEIMLGPEAIAQKPPQPQTEQPHELKAPIDSLPKEQAKVAELASTTAIDAGPTQTKQTINLGDPLQNSKTDAAVDAIMSEEGDLLLAAEDALRNANSSKHPVQPRDSSANKLWVALVLLIAMGLGLAAIHYLSLD